MIAGIFKAAQGPNLLNLSYVAELPTASSNLNRKFKVKDYMAGLKSVFQIWTKGRIYLVRSQKNISISSSVHILHAANTVVHSIHIWSHISIQICRQKSEKKRTSENSIIGIESHSSLGQGPNCKISVKCLSFWICTFLIFRKLNL